MNAHLYIMPKNEANHGHIGTVDVRVEVWIVTLTNDFYFFAADDGQMGCNGKDFS